MCPNDIQKRKKENRQRTYKVELAQNPVDKRWNFQEVSYSLSNLIHRTFRYSDTNHALNWTNPDLKIWKTSQTLPFFFEKEGDNHAAKLLDMINEKSALASIMS